MPHTFRTIVKPSRPPHHSGQAFTITHDDRIMTIGSCFSENIGRYFERYKFNIRINPFGQQYNPHSMAHAIRKLLSPTPYTEADLIYQEELYHSYDHHGSFSRATVEETLARINTNLRDSADFLKKATVLFLTFGTSHFFRLKENGRIVSNCHKVPSTAFDFQIMAPGEIVQEIEAAIHSLRQVNSGIKIILTVSPVRYFAFGHFENSVSKAHLFAAIHTLIQAHPDLYYFPAYELVMDDLRDYRFFAEDMLHPNYQATAYVWEAMAQTLLPAATQHLLKEIDEIVSAAHHRPRNPKSEAHQKFIERILQKMQKLGAQYGLDFRREKEKFSA